MQGCAGSGLIGVEAALRALDAVTPLPAVTVSIGHALHRVLAEPAYAARELPPFTQSAVDGYALRHADLANGPLVLAGVVRAGARDGAPRLVPGTAQRIYTGAMLPDGADSVLRQEGAHIAEGRLHATAPLAAGSDVRHRGEELAAGTMLAPDGTRITPGILAALAMAGVATVEARAAPRVAVLVTGDEVVAPGAATRPGQVHDANGPLVTGWLAAQGYAGVLLQRVADSAEAVRSALAGALARSNLVITTGGVSVGDHDYVPSVARALGVEPLFWKVAQKPGKPVFAGRSERALVLGLPGNPASVLVNLVVYVRRALDRLEGLREPGPRFVAGALRERERPDAARDHWLRVAVAHDETGCARLARLPKQASHMLSNLAQAGGLAWIPAGAAELPEGTVVRWLAL